MSKQPERISVSEWDARFDSEVAQLPADIPYLKRLAEYVAEGDARLSRLALDPAPATLWLWNFLLSEDDRLRDALNDGKKLVGTMKDLGTVPVMAYSLENLTAFYPDGAWWIPCIMEANATALTAADNLGINESFCPVRAMVGAMTTGTDFPVPELLICGVGATCDDFSALAQFLNGLGHPIHWWELPYRRSPDQGEPSIDLPGGVTAPSSLLDFVKGELSGIKTILESYAGTELTDEMLSCGITEANRARHLLREIREMVFTSSKLLLSPMELLVAEMLIIHYCSDKDECIRVLAALLELVKERANVFPDCTHGRAFWVNPPADIKAMNVFEDCGLRLCGTDFMFTHALDPIATDVPPLDALARSVLADPMIGPSSERARRIISECRRWNAEAVVVSRIPGASHCAFEGSIIKEMVAEELDIPVIELEIPPVCDALEQSIRTRLEALSETMQSRRCQ